MLFRSTNTKFTHFQGDVLSNVDDSSHGVKLSGGSTGGFVEPCGDEDNIDLTVRGKGTGALTIGATGAITALDSTAVRVGDASTTSISNIQRFLLQFTIPALSSAGQSAATSTVTHLSATTNAIYVVQQRVTYNSTEANAIHIDALCSTAAELRLHFWNQGASSLSGSTASAHLLQISF